MTTSSVADTRLPEEENGEYHFDLDADRRELAARWTVTAHLRFLSATQLGSQTSDYCDQTFERTEDGLPILRGSTLTGALQSLVRDWNEGYRSPGQKRQPPVAALFGAFDGPDAHESRILVFDSPANTEVATALRDGVRIVPTTGIAADGLKYDREVALPEQLLFPIRLDVVVPDGESEQSLLTTLLEALGCLTGKERGHLGARRSRGLGLCVAEGFRARRYDLRTAEGWLQYADSDYGLVPLQHLPPAQAFSCANQAIAAAWPACPFSLKGGEDQRRRILLNLDLIVDGTVLIRTPGGSAGGAADVAHLTEEGKALLSGASLSNAFFRQMLRILNTLGFTDADRDNVLADLFGGATEPNPLVNDPRGSRFWVEEAVIRGARSYRQTRVTIDRFTSGQYEGALFDEEPSVAGCVTVEILIRQSDEDVRDTDLPLALLAGRDLLESFVTVGGEASVGRGVLKGALTAIVLAPNQEKRQYRMTTEGGIEEPASATEWDAVLTPLFAYNSPEQQRAAGAEEAP